jgi:hypothetical protein
LADKLEVHIQACSLEVRKQACSLVERKVVGMVAHTQACKPAEGMVGKVVGMVRKVEGMHVVVGMEAHTLEGMAVG